MLVNGIVAVVSKRDLAQLGIKADGIFTRKLNQKAGSTISQRDAMANCHGAHQVGEISFLRCFAFDDGLRAAGRNRLVKARCFRQAGSFQKEHCRITRAAQIGYDFFTVCFAQLLGRLHANHAHGARERNGVAGGYDIGARALLAIEFLVVKRNVPHLLEACTQTSRNGLAFESVASDGGVCRQQLFSCLFRSHATILPQRSNADAFGCKFARNVSALIGAKHLRSCSCKAVKYLLSRVSVGVSLPYAHQRD